MVRIFKLCTVMFRISAPLEEVLSKPEKFNNRPYLIKRPIGSAIIRILLYLKERQHKSKNELYP